jgi:hypothetical protein
MIQDKTLSFPLFLRAKIIKAENPSKNPFRSIRLLLDREKYYWVAMMNFGRNLHDVYYVGKDLEEAIRSWEGEKEAWG